MSFANSFAAQPLRALYRSLRNLVRAVFVVTIFAGIAANAADPWGVVIIDGGKMFVDSPQMAQDVIALCRLDPKCEAYVMSYAAWQAAQSGGVMGTITAIGNTAIPGLGAVSAPVVAVVGGTIVIVGSIGGVMYYGYVANQNGMGTGQFLSETAGNYLGYLDNNLYYINPYHLFW